MRKPSGQLLQKYDELKAYLFSLESAAVAFSGGVDSTFLLFAASEALGDRTMAVSASSCSFPERELNEAKEFCRSHGIRHEVVKSEELQIEGFSHNPKNRCYLCKRELFGKISDIAGKNGIKEVVEGSNLDDNRDYRPGLKAIDELHVKSPLRHVGFTKEEIRTLSRYLGLPTWNKQSFACLASRFPYGDEITEKKLAMVDRAEQLLIDLGFHQLRVRIHGEIARIELEPVEFGRFMEEETRLKVYSEFKRFGFTYVTLDILGYRTGSMNETLTEEERTIMELFNGRPDNMEGRLEREVRTYDYLDNLGIAYQRTDHERADNMQACNQIDAVLGVIICKNLFLCNRQKTHFYLLMMPGDKKFKTKELSKQIGSARLSFADPEDMLKYLDIEPGAVSIMGLMNDQGHAVKLLIDEDVLRGEYIGCHPCVCTSSLKLRTEDVIKTFLPATGHTYETVRLVGAD